MSLVEPAIALPPWGPATTASEARSAWEAGDRSAASASAWLAHAVASQSPGAVAGLLDAGVPADHPCNDQGATALHEAFRQHRKTRSWNALAATVRTLLDAGASPRRAARSHPRAIRLPLAAARWAPLWERLPDASLQALLVPPRQTARAGANTRWLARCLRDGSKSAVERLWGAGGRPHQKSVGRKPDVPARRRAPSPTPGRPDWPRRAAAGMGGPRAGKCFARLICMAPLELSEFSPE